MEHSLIMSKMDESLKASLKKLDQPGTNSAAILMKIDREKRLSLEEEYEDISLDQLRYKLPKQEPRYIMYSYRPVRDDGTTTHYLCFILCSPAGCKSRDRVMYAVSVREVAEALWATKVFDVTDPEELTDEWLKNQLTMTP